MNRVIEPRPTTRSRIEDLEFLVGQGVSIREAVQRAGWATIDAAEVALRRTGHPLAARVCHERDQERKAARRTRPVQWRPKPESEHRTVWLDAWRQG